VSASSVTDALWGGGGGGAQGGILACDACVFGRMNTCKPERIVSTAVAAVSVGSLKPGVCGLLHRRNSPMMQAAPAAPSVNVSASHR
jgi:hypothetical protein